MATSRRQALRAVVEESVPGAMRGGIDILIAELSEILDVALD